MIIRPDFYLEALIKVHPTIGTTERPEGGAMSAWDSDGNSITLDDSKITIELDKLEAAYDALEYARNRAAEYPTVAELTISLFDAADKAALVTKRAAVKTKWPKDNSGPIA